jgi:hypothetical protein
MIHEIIWEAGGTAVDRAGSKPSDWKMSLYRTSSKKTHIDGLGQKPGLQCDKPVTNVQCKIPRGTVYSNIGLLIIP